MIGMLSWLLYKTTAFRRVRARCRGMPVRLLIADTFATQLVGLMYRSGLGKGEGMLFVFGRESRWGIWMQNMKFPIDIIWLDKDWVVVGIKRNARPARSFLDVSVYRPRRAARYVLEFAAGFASRNRIRIGDAVQVRYNLR